MLRIVCLPDNTGIGRSIYDIRHYGKIEEYPNVNFLVTKVSRRLFLKGSDTIKNNIDFTSNDEIVIRNFTCISIKRFEEILRLYYSANSLSINNLIKRVKNDEFVGVLEAARVFNMRDYELIRFLNSLNVRLLITNIRIADFLETDVLYLLIALLAKKLKYDRPPFFNRNSIPYFVIVHLYISFPDITDL